MPYFHHHWSLFKLNQNDLSTSIEPLKNLEKFFTAKSIKNKKDYFLNEQTWDKNFHSVNIDTTKETVFRGKPKSNYWDDDDTRDANSAINDHTYSFQEYLGICLSNERSNILNLIQEHITTKPLSEGQTSNYLTNNILAGIKYIYDTWDTELSNNYFSTLNNFLVDLHKYILERYHLSLNKKSPAYATISTPLDYAQNFGEGIVLKVATPLDILEKSKYALTPFASSSLEKPLVDLSNFLTLRNITLKKNLTFFNPKTWNDETTLFLEKNDKNDLIIIQEASQYSIDLVSGNEQKIEKRKIEITFEKFLHRCLKNEENKINDRIEQFISSNSKYISQSENFLLFIFTDLEQIFVRVNSNSLFQKYPIINTFLKDLTVNLYKKHRRFFTNSAFERILNIISNSLNEIDQSAPHTTKKNNQNVTYFDFGFKKEEYPTTSLEELCSLEIGKSKFIYNNISVDNFVNIFSKKNQVLVSTEIIFGMETMQIAYILLDKLQPYFDNLTKEEIEKATCFRTKPGKNSTYLKGENLKRSLSRYIKQKNSAKNKKTIDHKILDIFSKDSSPKE